MKLNVAEASRPRSWADLVRGKENAVGTEPQTRPEPTPSPSTGFFPGKRGEKSSLCRGKLLVMLGHYGWIAPSQSVNHPDANRRGGRIYLSRKDIRSCASLEVGAEVEFFLYVDADGLGAEDCHAVAEGLSKNVFRARQWHPPALTHQVHAVPSPGPVILLRPAAVHHWMQETCMAKTLQPCQSSDESFQTVVSEASTSAGESGSESESFAKRIGPKASRRTAVSVGLPPGLTNTPLAPVGALLPPPGLELLSA
jgi:hypothetical protein